MSFKRSINERPAQETRPLFITKLYIEPTMFSNPMKTSYTEWDIEED